MIRIAFAHPLRKLEPGDRAEHLARELVGDFVSNEVIERAVAGYRNSARRYQAVDRHAGVAQEHVGREGIRGEAADSVVFVKEDQLPPAGIADVYVVVAVGGPERGLRQFGFSEGENTGG